MSPERIITQDVALNLAQKARRSVLERLKELGLSFEPGTLNALGKPITEEEYLDVCRIIDEAGMKLLGASSQIIPEEARPSKFSDEEIAQRRAEDWERIQKVKEETRRLTTPDERFYRRRSTY